MDAVWATPMIVPQSVRSSAAYLSTAIQQSESVQEQVRVLTKNFFMDLCWYMNSEDMKRAPCVCSLWARWMQDVVRERIVMQPTGSEPGRGPYDKHSNPEKQLFRTYLGLLGRRAALHSSRFSHVPGSTLRTWASDTKPLPTTEYGRRKGAGRPATYSIEQLACVFEALEPLRNAGKIYASNIVDVARRLLPRPSPTTYPLFDFSKDWAHDMAVRSKFKLTLDLPEQKLLTMSLSPQEIEKLCWEFLSLIYQFRDRLRTHVCGGDYSKEWIFSLSRMLNFDEMKMSYGPSRDRLESVREIHSTKCTYLSLLFSLTLHLPLSLSFSLSLSLSLCVCVSVYRRG